MSSVSKISLLLLSTSFLTIALTPPNPPPSKDERVKSPGDDMLPAVGIVYIPIAYKSTIWLFTLLEAYLILSSPTDSTDPHSYLVQVLRGLGGHRALVTSNLQMVSTPFICGFILVMSASIVRWYCYRILGHLFTFQLAVLPNHKLITHGPYSFVRHPAYTATMLMSIGVPLVYSGPGSLLYELCGPRLMQICIASGCGTWFMVGKRVNIEDQMLKKEFGKQWDDWARIVRWKLVPGIF